MIVRAPLVSALVLSLAASLTASLGACASAPESAQHADRAPAGVIFLHPDGSGANMWGATRMLYAGPDGDLNWDKLSVIGLYRGHLRDALAASSNAGGTIHAYGLKAGETSFGNDNGAPLVRDGKPAISIAREAISRGHPVGIVSTAAVVDAGTGTFLASTSSRKNYTEIATQMLDSGADVLLGGGEQFFLPKGAQGRHGPGEREDGRDLIKLARERGYTVVYTAEELARVPAGTRKLLGLFAANDTFLDKSEEKQKSEGTPDTVPGAPTYAQMVRAALDVLSSIRPDFLLVAEEEATDNFGGENNARATMAAAKRADDAIGVAREFVAKHPRTLLMVAADSDCGGMQVYGEPDMPADKPLPARDENGAPMDGREGTGTPPFVAAPDRTGKRLTFGVVWASEGDLAGAVLVRGEGHRARELITPSMDNTRIYAAMRAALFGETLK